VFHRNLSGTAHFHTVEIPKSRISINNEWKPEVSHVIIWCYSLPPWLYFRIVWDICNIFQATDHCRKSATRTPECRGLSKQILVVLVLPIGTWP
jgi:hypothetical protein